MSRTSVSSVVAGIAACVAVLLVAAPAVADPHDDQARVERELATTKAALEASSEKVVEAGIAYEQASRLLPEVQRRLADAKGVLAGAQAAAKSAAAAVERANADLAAADRQVDVASARLEQTRDEVSAYAVEAFKGRDIAGVQAMLSIQDPANFVAGLTYMEKIAANERAAVARHTLASIEAQNSLSAQELQQRRAIEAQREAEAALVAADQAAAAAAAAERQVADLIAQKQQALAVAEGERTANEARYAELVAESERIAAEVRAMAAAPATSGPTVQAGARLPMPVQGYKTSDFGNRFDPVYKVYQLHAGVDFAARAGTAILAVAAGSVFRAGWNGGYGNYTCVYHGTVNGKGFATCYAHQSAILVKVGQQVRPGQLIGRVGTTGASTGNHLHFEVRLDGTPVNPLPWLPACLC